MIITYTSNSSDNPPNVTVGRLYETDTKNRIINDVGVRVEVVRNESVPHICDIGSKFIDGFGGYVNEEWKLKAIIEIVPDEDEFYFHGRRRKDNTQTSFARSNLVRGNYTGKQLREADLFSGNGMEDWFEIAPIGYNGVRIDVFSRLKEELIELHSDKSSLESKIETVKSKLEELMPSGYTLTEKHKL